MSSVYYVRKRTLTIKFGNDYTSTPRHLDTSAVLPLASPPRRKAWPHTRAQRWREQVPAHRAVEVCWMVGHPTPLKAIETSCVSRHEAVRHAHAHRRRE